MLVHAFAGMVDSEVGVIPAPRPPTLGERDHFVVDVDSPEAAADLPEALEHLSQDVQRFRKRESGYGGKPFWKILCHHFHRLGDGADAHVHAHYLCAVDLHQPDVL